jgi:hypothetical protein
MRNVTYSSLHGFTLVLMAALGTSCSRDSSLIQGLSGPCPTYSGGSASPARLAGTYTVVSYCQNSLPASGPAGSLTLTASPDSMNAWINRGRLSPVTVAGPYTVSRDTITVSSPPGSLGSFVGTYAFSANTLYMSGSLEDGRLFVAIVATK